MGYKIKINGISSFTAFLIGKKTKKAFDESLYRSGSG
jgi:hypothetical protein